MEPDRKVPPHFDDLSGAEGLTTAYVEFSVAGQTINLNVRTWRSHGKVQAASSTVTVKDTGERWEAKELQVNIERCPTAHADNASWVKQTCEQSDGKRRHVWGRMKDPRLTSFPNWITVHVPA